MNRVETATTAGAAVFEMPVFSGLGDGAFDAGTQAIKRMIDAIPDLKEADHWRWWQWEEATDAIIARAKRYGPPTVITIGHSMGCDSNVKMAWRLNEAGIPVAYMGQIDPTAGRKMVVPPNVSKVQEFWSKPGWFGRIFNAPYNARIRAPDGLRGGKMIYPKGWAGQSTIFEIAGSHVGVASDPVTRKTIVASVKKVLSAA